MSSRGTKPPRFPEEVLRGLQLGDPLHEKPPAATPMTSAVNHTLPRGGGGPRFWTPTPPPTNCWPEAPLEGGGSWHSRTRGVAPPPRVPYPP